MKLKDYVFDKLDFFDAEEWLKRTERSRFILTMIVCTTSFVLSIFLPSGKSNLKLRKDRQEKVKTISKNQN